MVGSRERQHNDRIARIDKYRMKLLPIAVLYGGNASGKTNFFKALNFMKQLITSGTKTDAQIKVLPFKLDSEYLQKPSRFEIEILIEGIIYEYGFSVTKKEVLEEKLVKITSSSETILFNRTDDKIEWAKTFEKDQFFEFIFRGTRKNQLFLTNSISQNADSFRPIHNWFKYNLQLIAPDWRFGALERFLNEKDPLFSAMNEILLQIDTGISKLDGVEVEFSDLPYPEEMKTKIMDDISDNTAFIIPQDNIVIKKENGELNVKRLLTQHTKSDGSQTTFELHEESDGSKRIVDLLPVFLDISEKNSNMIYVIDELDRSLHTILTRKLIESYLDGCSTDSRSQLLFTTHDLLLMDQSLLRRDEMWVTERDNLGATNLFSFAEFIKDIRFDKDIRKSYLQGRMGGIPRILLENVLRDSRVDK